MIVLLQWMKTMFLITICSKQGFLRGPRGKLPKTLQVVVGLFCFVELLWREGLP